MAVGVRDVGLDGLKADIRLEVLGHLLQVPIGAADGQLLAVGRGGEKCADDALADLCGCWDDGDNHVG
jgi:hypothetical protein